MTDSQRVRVYRIVALGLAWLFPLVGVLLGGGDLAGLLSALVYPTFRKLLLVVGIGLQIRRLARPTGGPRTIELLATQGELGILGLLLFFDFSLWYVNRGFGGDVVQTAFRVIDGETRTVSTGDLASRATSFDALRGLGLIETRLLRGGAQVGMRYDVGLFGNDGPPKKLVPCASVAEVDAQILALHTQTGIPIARAS